jgi:hypothetical protein
LRLELELVLELRLCKHLSGWLRVLESWISKIWLLKDLILVLLRKLELLMRILLDLECLLLVLLSRLLLLECLKLVVLIIDQIRCLHL